MLKALGPPGSRPRSTIRFHCIFRNVFCLSFRPGVRFPKSENAAKHVLALPIYPELTPEMIDYVADAALAASFEAPAVSRLMHGAVRKNVY